MPTFRSLLNLMPSAPEGVDWQRRLTFELWLIRLENRGEIGEPLPLPVAPVARPVATPRLLAAYLGAIDKLEKQTNALGQGASDFAAEHLTLLRSGIPRLVSAELTQYHLAERPSSGAKEARSTRQLKRLNDLLAWVPTRKRWTCLTELHAFATETTPRRPEQIRMLLKDAARRERDRQKR